MRHINPTKAAITVGAVTGLWHLFWATLVGFGWAKPVMDFILRLHFLRLQYDLSPFAFETAAGLVVLTFVIGGLFGLIFALIWNWLTFESSPAWARDSKPLGGTISAQLGDS